MTISGDSLADAYRRKLITKIELPDKEQAEQKAQRLAERLRVLGINPDDIL
jgi:hypothetical protein